MAFLLFKKRNVIPRSVYKDFDNFVAEGVRKREWAAGTETRWKTFRGNLVKFNPRLTYESLTEEGLDAYLTFLLEDLGLRNSTASKELRLLKWFLKWAESKGYNKCRDYTFYHPKLKTVKNPVVFLTREELFKLYYARIPACYPSSDMLSKSRDMFCFCCFTSLRYSDMINLKKCNIHRGKIILTTQKTNDTLTIEINRYAQEILDKYCAGKKSEERIFPYISNPHMNQCLKALGQICEFNTPETRVYFRGRERIERTDPKWQCLSTHSARRTFICNALSSGVNTQTIMKWTGHSDYASMKPYIDVSDEEMKISMQRVF